MVGETVFFIGEIIVDTTDVCAINSLRQIYGEIAWDRFSLLSSQIAEHGKEYFFFDLTHWMVDFT
jgi:hypothetical protein